MQHKPSLISDIYATITIVAVLGIIMLAFQPNSGYRYAQISSEAALSGIWNTFTDAEQTAICNKWNKDTIATYKTINNLLNNELLLKDFNYWTGDKC